MPADLCVFIVWHTYSHALSNCIAGYNVCIFAYGQTGSGKTHTMAGTNIEQYEGRGINYRALDDLFALNAKRQGEVSEPFHHVCKLLHASASCHPYVFFRFPRENANLCFGIVDRVYQRPAMLLGLKYPADIQCCKYTTRLAFEGCSDSSCSASEYHHL